VGAAEGRTATFVEFALSEIKVNQAHLNPLQFVSFASNARVKLNTTMYA
jgi:hypothetical protein